MPSNQVIDAPPSKKKPAISTWAKNSSVHHGNHGSDLELNVNSDYEPSLLINTEIKIFAGSLPIVLCHALRKTQRYLGER